MFLLTVGFGRDPLVLWSFLGGVLWGFCLWVFARLVRLVVFMWGWWVRVRGAVRSCVVVASLLLLLLIGSVTFLLVVVVVAVSFFGCGGRWVLGRLALLGLGLVRWGVVFCLLCLRCDVHSLSCQVFAF